MKYQTIDFLDEFSFRLKFLADYDAGISCSSITDRILVWIGLPQMAFGVLGVNNYLENSSKHHTKLGIDNSNFFFKFC